MRTSSLPAPQAQGYDSTRRKPPRFFLLGVAALPAPPTWVAQAGSMNGLPAESTPKEILGCKASEDKTRVLCQDFCGIGLAVLRSRLLLKQLVKVCFLGATEAHFTTSVGAEIAETRCIIETDKYKNE